MFGRQPHLLVDVALGLAPCTITESNTAKFVQKLREQNKWAHEKVEAFQAKEAKRHKHNYDKKGKAVTLEVHDLVYYAFLSLVEKETKPMISDLLYHPAQVSWSNGLVPFVHLPPGPGEPEQ